MELNLDDMGFVILSHEEQRYVDNKNKNNPFDYTKEFKEVYTVLDYITLKLEILSSDIISKITNTINENPYNIDTDTIQRFQINLEDQYNKMIRDSNYLIELHLQNIT
jgi:hypothetical protein